MMKRLAPYHSLFRADLVAIYERLQPKTVGCFDVAELSFLPLAAFVRGGSATTFIDGQAGSVRALLASEVVAADGRQCCVASGAAVVGGEICDAYAPAEIDGKQTCLNRVVLPRELGCCTHFVPGRKLRVINGDARRGRTAAFATRVETVVATAATSVIAVETAIEMCAGSARLDVPLPIEDGAFDLVISVLAPSQLMDQPYAYFDELMTRRFGPWGTQPSADLVRKRDALRLTLFQSQLDAHVRELARLTQALHGRMYFATIPAEPAPDGGWLLERGFAECFDTLARYFIFDFDTFPAEAFLRRSRDDRSVVLQAALLRPKPEGSTP